MKQERHSRRYLSQRICVFVATMFTTFVLCFVHGIYGSRRTITIIDNMIDSGKTIGKFWRIRKTTPKTIILTKYNRNIILSAFVPKSAKVGDKVSFVAVGKNQSGIEGKNSVIWKPEKIYFHGRSTRKFLLSIPVLVIIALMGWRYLSFDKNSLGLTFRRE